MRACELSFDLWNEIIDVGQLDVLDVINLSRTNREFRQKFRDYKWYRLLMRSYLDVLILFRIDWAVRLRDQCQGYRRNAFRTVLEFHLKEVRFNNYDPTNQPVSAAVDLFGDNYVYIPIAYRKYYKTLGIAESTEGQKNFDLATKSMCSSILLAQCLKLGMHYLKSLFEDERKLSLADPVDLENFWFHTSLMETGSHFLVLSYHLWLQSFSRANKLNYLLLFQHLGIDISHNAREKPRIKLDKVQLLSILNYTTSIVSLNLPGFRFSLKSADYTMSTLKDWTEDFNLFRIITGHSVGTMCLLPCILFKVLEDQLFSKFDFDLSHDSFADYGTKLVPGVTLLGLRINDFVFEHRKASGDFQTRTVRSDVLFSLLPPLTVEQAIRVYNLHDPQTIHSLVGPYSETHKCFSTESIYRPISTEYLKLTKYLFAKLRSMSDSKNRKLSHIMEFARDLEGFDRFLSYHTILRFCLSFDDVEKYIGLYRSKQVSKRSQDFLVRKLAAGGSLEDDGKYKPGTVVATRRGHFAIVLGKMKNDATVSGNMTYYKVYTSKTTIEVCQDLQEIDYCEYFPGLMHFLLSSCGEEILGQVFSHLDVEIHPPRFIMKPDVKLYLGM